MYALPKFASNDDLVKHRHRSHVYGYHFKYGIGPPHAKARAPASPQDAAVRTTDAVDELLSSAQCVIIAGKPRESRYPRH